MTKIRVLVVEDSLTVRKRLVGVLAAQPDIDVVGEAGDGRRAIEMCESLKPDVVSLDMMLPVMTGLAATEYVMAYCPTPILIVSASTNRGELFRTYEALAAGAVDVLEKPTGDEIDGQWEERYCAALRLVARIKVITHPRARLGALGKTSRPGVALAARNPGGPCRAIAIGVSTGGPAAVSQILQGLPPKFPIPILLVVHIAPSFSTALADWLDSLSPIRVAFAREGEPLPPFGIGKVILAPPDSHLVFARGRLRVSNEPERHSCRPSVDVLFESVARELGDQVVGCLLTGMGRDGAEGLLAIRRAGGITIAQDEASSVVFGMPREAILIGAAERVLSLDQIAPALNTLGAHANGEGVE